MPLQTTEELSKLMPEDFNKKLREWEQIKITAKPGEAPGAGAGAQPDTGEKKVKKKRKSQERCVLVVTMMVTMFLMMVMIRWVRGGGKKLKEESRGEMSDIPEVGTFAWLDKELQKVNREKTRLERERLKTAEVRPV